MHSWAYGKELRGFLHAPSRRTENSTLATPSCLSSLCFGAIALWLGHVQAELSASLAKSSAVARLAFLPHSHSSDGKAAQDLHWLPCKSTKEWELGASPWQCALLFSSL